MDAKLHERVDHLAKAVLVLAEEFRRLNLVSQAVDLFALRDRARADSYWEQQLAGQADKLQRMVEGFAHKALDAMREEKEEEASHAET